MKDLEIAAPDDMLSKPSRDTVRPVYEAFMELSGDAGDDVSDHG